MKKFSKEIERLANKEIKEYGYTREDLTEEEFQELMEDIQERINFPDNMLDGFWFTAKTEIDFRKLLKGSF